MALTCSGESWVEGVWGRYTKAYHRRTKRRVALKVIDHELFANPTALKRFSREIKAVGRLSHPNIAARYDSGEAHGSPYLVVEYVKGADLC